MVRFTSTEYLLASFRVFLGEMDEIEPPDAGEQYKEDRESTICSNGMSLSLGLLPTMHVHSPTCGACERGPPGELRERHAA